MTHLVLGKNGKGKVLCILGDAENLEAAEVIGQGSKTPDYHIIPQASLAELSMPELVACHNKLVDSEHAVARFENRTIAAQRLWNAWLRARPALEVEPPKRAKAKLNGSHRLAFKAAGQAAVITLLPCPPKKRWQKSARKRVYDWLIAHPGSTVEWALKSCGVPAGKALGCLSKLAASKLIELKAAE